MANEDKIGTALKRLLTFGVLFGTQLVKTSVATTVAGPVGAVASMFPDSMMLLDTANTLAGGIAGNSLYDGLFKSGAELQQNKDLQKVTSEAVCRALEDVSRVNSSNEGLAEMVNHVKRTNINWLTKTIANAGKSFNDLTAEEMQQLCSDGELLQLQDMRVIVEQITLTEDGSVSFLDDDALDLAATSLKKELPVKFVDVLTDPHSEKPFKEITLKFLMGLSTDNSITHVKLDEILSRFDRLEAPAAKNLPNDKPPRKKFVPRAEHQSQLRKWREEGIDKFVLYGLPGAGKTALATEFYYEMEDDYEARLYFDMQGFGGAPKQPVEAMTSIISSFGIKLKENATEDEITGEFYEIIQAQKTMLFLDNIRGQFDLKPFQGLNKITFLVTSRPHITLDDGRELQIKEMSKAEGLAMLEKYAGSDRLQGFGKDICEQCGYLAQAIYVAGTLLRKRNTLKAETIAARLKEDRFGTFSQYHDKEVFAAFNASYEYLEAADLWRKLTIFPGWFGAAETAAICNNKTETAETILGDFESEGMVEFDPATELYRLHDLARDFAQLKLIDTEGEDGKKMLHKKAADFYITRRRPESEWKSIEDLQPQLEELFHRTEAKQFVDVALLLEELDFNYLFKWGHYRLLITFRNSIMDKILVPEGERNNLGYLGLACTHLGDYKKAIEYQGRALEISRKLNDRKGEGVCLGNLGLAYIKLEQYEKAIEYHEQALEIAREIGDRLGECNRLGNLSSSYGRLGDTEKEIEYVKKTLGIARELGNARIEGKSLANLGSAYAMQQKFQEAIEYTKQALEIAYDIGDKMGEASRLSNLGIYFNVLGEVEMACAYWQKALVSYEAIESPLAKEVRQWLSETNCVNS